MFAMPLEAEMAIQSESQRRAARSQAHCRGAAGRTQPSEGFHWLEVAGLLGSEQQVLAAAAASAAVRSLACRLH